MQEARTRGGIARRDEGGGARGAEGVQVIELGREGVWDAGDSDWTKGRTHRKASHGSRGAQCRV